jgi:hypothetical protein
MNQTFNIKEKFLNLDDYQIKNAIFFLIKTAIDFISKETAILLAFYASRRYYGIN